MMFFINRFIFLPAKKLANILNGLIDVVDLLFPFLAAAMVIIPLAYFPISLLGVKAGVYFSLYAFVFLGIVALFMIGGALLIGSWLLGEFYDPKLESAKYKRQAELVSATLRKHGSLPIKGLCHYYNFDHKPSRRKLLTEEKFSLIQSATDEYALDSQTKLISLKPALPVIETIPAPQDGNYVKGYYEMYERMKRLHENSDLANVPLSLIDTLYPAPEPITKV
jgi:hypothetical protein